MAFKSWLKRTIGEKNYRYLDPGDASQKISSIANEGKKMKELLRAFEPYKWKFSKDSWDILLDLPEPLDDLTIENNVLGGELRITN